MNNSKSIFNFSFFIFVILFSLSEKISAQNCPNIGFQNGNFNNWVGYTGNYAIPNDAFGIQPGQHTIHTVPGIDPFTCGGLNVLPPGGGNSAQLGNSNVGAQAEQLVYVIDVSSQNSIFTYQYASVMEDPGHDPSEQPKLSIRVLDNSGNVVGGSCGVFEVYAGQAGQVFQSCGGVKWLPWSSAAIDLLPYIGQQIRIEFTTYDCAQGGHFGYSYISANCMPLVDDVSFCQGQNAVITAPVGFQQYNWSNGQNTQTATFVSPAASQTVSCDLSSVGNQGTCAVQVQYQLNVSTVNANFSSLPNCLNVQSTFTNSSTASVDDVITSWNWDFGDNGTSGAENPTHLYASSGSFPVELIIGTQNGCTDTIEQNYSVYSLPLANFDVLNACFYDSLSIMNQSLGLNLTYSWTFEDGFATTSANPADHSFVNPGEYDIELVVTSSEGCMDSITKIATAFDKPIAQFSVDSVCLGLNSIYIDGSTIPVPLTDNITNWSWDFGDATFSNTQNPNHNYAYEDIFAVQLIVTTANGCKDTTISDAVVWPNPISAFTAIEACEYDPLNFNDLSTVSNLNSTNSLESWSWSYGDGNTSSNQNNSHLFSNDGLYNVQLSVTTNNGCSHNSSQLIQVYPKPEAHFDGFNLIACSPNCATVFSTSTVNQPSAINSFNWTFSNGFTSSQDSLTYCLVNETDEPISLDVELIVQTDFGCKDTNSIADYIVSNPNPIAEFTFQPNQPDIIHDLVQFNNLSYNADNYYWDFQGAGNSTLFEPELHFPFQLEAYTIQLIAETSEGCRDTAYAQLTVKDVLLLYVPNTFTPDGDEYNNGFHPVFSSEIEPENYLLSIFNRWGEIIFQSLDVDQGWDGVYGDGFVEDGTYVWKIEFKHLNNGYSKTGHVNLLR